MRHSLGRPWFGPHRYGIGVSGPITWQGWAVVAVGGAALAVDFWLVRGRGQTTIAFATAAVVGLIGALKTKGGWRWRWGEDD